MRFNKYVKFILEAERKIAFESLDHLNPLGTARDNSINHRFNHKIYKIFDGVEKPLRVLDIGCSGGGFVRSCIDDGCLAVGLEGSDYSMILGRAEWKTIPNNLFTCDVTRPFQIKFDNGGDITNFKFHVVTSWEVMEHISEVDIALVAKNVQQHLIDGGIWAMSISYVDDFINGVNLHRTVNSKSWWVNKFKELGFAHIENYENYFNTQYIRGNKFGASHSFNLVLTNNPSAIPILPKYPLIEKCYDIWRGSRFHRLLNKLMEL